jgi:dUTP pyrophosphatase
LMVSCWNRSAKSYELNPFDRLAQLVLVPIVRAAFTETTDFEPSDRAHGGFGSSGVS